MLEAKDLLKKLTEENVVKILESIGGTLYSPFNGREMIFFSLCHEGGEDRPKLYCYPSSENGFDFHCYICEFHGNIIDLIMHVKKCQFLDAFKVVREVLGVFSWSNHKKSFGEIPILSNDYWKLLRSTKVKKTEFVGLTPYDEKVLGLFTKDYHISWIKDHITIKSMEKFGIGYYSPQNAITIPHRDINGNFVGLRKRNLDEYLVSLKLKYMPMKIQGIEYTHHLMFNLYGIFENKNTIKKVKKVCLFEAEKSVMQIESYYEDNNWSLALCGGSFSKYQRDLLLSLGVEEVIICLDRDWIDRDDFKYALFKKKYMNIAQKLAPYMNVYIVEKDMDRLLDLKESPSDKGKEAFEELLHNKRLITLDEIQQFFIKERE